MHYSPQPTISYVSRKICTYLHHDHVSQINPRLHLASVFLFIIPIAWDTELHECTQAEGHQETFAALIAAKVNVMDYTDSLQ
jgi:hypothetical protein